MYNNIMVEFARRVVFTNHYNTKSDSLIKSLGNLVFSSKGEAKKFLFNKG
jgi:hypothetical protein